MKKNGLIVRLLAVLGVIFCLCGGRTGSAFAEDRPEHHLGITPTQSNLGMIEPGQTYTGSFDVVNEGYGASEFEVSFVSYSVKDETYEPVFGAVSSYGEMAGWITTSVDGGILEPGERETIDFTIDVPADAHGGSQSAVIMIRLKTDDEVEKTAVNMIQQLGYLVFANVNGDIVETGKILENKVPSFLFNPPVYGTSVVENTGNVYTTAEYVLQVFPLFSDEEVYTNEEEPEKNIIFPETKRLNQIEWEGAPQLGIFRVKSTVKIFDEESVTEKIVFLCPIWFLFIILLLIFCIIFWLVSRIFRRKREA